VWLAVFAVGTGLALWALLALRGGDDRTFVPLPDSAIPCPVEVAGLALDYMEGEVNQGVEVAGLALDYMEGEVNQGGDYDGRVRADCWYGDDGELWIRVWWTVATTEPDRLLYCGGARGSGLREEDVRDDGTLTGIVRHPSSSLEIEHIIDPGVTIDRDQVWQTTQALLEIVAPHAKPCGQ
jgi:hypothetical protein